MIVPHYELETHFNCVGCKRRCITDEDYKENMNMNDEKLDWNCLVKEEEIDVNLKRPDCYEEAE